MVKKDYLFGLLGGFCFFMVWYVNAAFETTLFFNETIFEDIYSIMYICIVPLLSAVLAIYLVHHKNYKYTWVKFGIFLVSAAGFTFLLFMKLPSLESVFAFFNHELLNSYGMRGTMYWFGLGAMTNIYLWSFVILFLIYFFIRIVAYLIIRIKNRNKNWEERFKRE